MAFRPPGGELNFWSVLWILFGVAGTILAVMGGPPILYLWAPIMGLPALGMWFEQRWCGYIIGAMLIVSLPLGV